jgi:Ser/Thr protein kinase RdoA (MazF antagonist)
VRDSLTELVRLLPRLESLLGEVRDILPLPSGAGGQSHRVSTASGNYVVKVFIPDAPVLLGPAAQHALLGALAASGIAPRPIACDPAARLLVTEFVDGAEVGTAERLGRGDGIVELATLLRRLHSVAFLVPPFAPLEYARRYLARIGGFDSLSRADRERFAELLAQGARPLPGPPCLCHNDLTADNLLLGPAPRLIDFDYAAIATPILDLASAVFMNSLPADAASSLLDAYHEGPAPYPIEEFARVQRLLALLAHFWSLAAGPEASQVVARYRIRDD